MSDASSAYSNNRKEVLEMTAGVIAVLVIGTPFILLPVAYVWYLNIGGIVSLVRNRHKETAPEKKHAKAAAKQQA